MKRIVVAGLVVVFFGNATLPAQSPAPPAAAEAMPPGVSPTPASSPPVDDETRLLAIEQEWRNACLHGDADYLARLLADDFVRTDERGQTSDQAEEIRRTRERTVHYTVYENHDVMVRVHGDTAVVTGGARLKGTVAATGKPVDAEDQFTDVFARIDGQWRAVAAHVSRVGG